MESPIEQTDNLVRITLKNVKINDEDVVEEKIVEFTIPELDVEYIKNSEQVTIELISRITMVEEKSLTDGKTNLKKL